MRLEDEPEKLKALYSVEAHRTESSDRRGHRIEGDKKEKRGAPSTPVKSPEDSAGT